MPITDAEGGLGTGGVDLGSMGQLHGHIPGLQGATTLASTGLPLWAEAQLFPNRQPGKDYNDGPVPHTVGSDGGQKVHDPGWMPPF